MAGFCSDCGFPPRRQQRVLRELRSATRGNGRPPKSSATDSAAFGGARGRQKRWTVRLRMGMLHSSATNRFLLLQGQFLCGCATGYKISGQVSSGIRGNSKGEPSAGRDVHGPFVPS